MKSLQAVYDKIKFKDMNNIDALEDIDELFSRLEDFMMQVEQTEQYKDLKKCQQKIIDEFNKISFINHKTKLIALCKCCIDLINEDNISKNNLCTLNALVRYLVAECSSYVKSSEYTHCHEDILNLLQDNSIQKNNKITKTWLLELKSNIENDNYTKILGLSNDIQVMLIYIL